MERGSSGRRDISTLTSSLLAAWIEVEGESLLISSPRIASGAQPYMAQDLTFDQYSGPFAGKGGTNAPQRVIRVVANWKEVENGARIIEAANASCDIPQAVVISTRYLCKSLALRVSGGGLFRTGYRVVSSEGNDTRNGRMIELVKDIMENKTKAKEPFLAISPTMSSVVCSSAALSAFWR